MRKLAGCLAFVLACAAVGCSHPDRAEPGSPGAAGAIESGWLTQTRQQIAEREYRASQNPEGLQAPNRAHNLRTFFTATGIQVHDRTAGRSPELLRLSLTGLGRGERLGAVAPGDAVVAQESRVEIPRAGLVEWYVNSAAGLEQGFTLAEQPAGAGALVLELAVGGARPALRGNEIVFDTRAQRKLRYGDLAVTDATGRMLAARFEVASVERLRIVVDDAGAAYPVAIDPLLTQTWDTQLESNMGLAHLGTSVAPAGDVNGDGYADVIVGAPNALGANGAAYIFLGGPSGIPSGGPSGAATVLTATQFGSSFGQSVASAGDVNGDGYADVIVGAPGYDAGQGYLEGAAFVFLGGSGGIASGNESTAAARLESNQASAHLGQSVASAGDVNGDGYSDVIVGAVYYDDGQTDEGAAFVFLGGASGIANGNPGTAAAVLEANQTSAFFGGAVASAGDVNGDGYSDVIVGASSYDNGQADEGAAFIFLGSASGIASGNPGTAATLIESNQTSRGRRQRSRPGLQCGPGGRREWRRLRRRDRGRALLRQRSARRGRGVGFPRRSERIRERQPFQRGGAARIEPGGHADWRAPRLQRGLGR